ncbi:unnamed protein product, partial [Pieris macdunnoughi]
MYCEVGPSGKALSEPKVERCASVPCLHSTGCRDTPNGFRCDCEAGWTGARCEVNITPSLAGDCGRGCANGGACRGTECDCRPGKNCEIDIEECESNPCKYDGICLERSNTSLYQTPDSPPVLVGPQPHMLLPQVFYQPFSLENAGG